MSTSPDRADVSPWRPILEQVRAAVATRRDERGVVGSINWLRFRMKERGANPNVVRNIIYRDKGRMSDKRVLFEILNEAWTATGREPLQAPELELLLSPQGGAEEEALQLLGRETRRAFRTFVGAMREGGHPKLLVTGRSGSGKTMLADYVQRALHLAPWRDSEVVRMEFGNGDLGTELTRLGGALGASRSAMEARLAKIAASGAFAVQADAQADLVRVVVDAARARQRDVALLLHLSQGLASRGTLGSVPLRLNTPHVPRVAAPEWLWETLLAPLTTVPGVSVLATMTEAPSAALRAEGYEGPLKLTPPTSAEARRFVGGRLPQLPADQQEDMVRRAGRSFEELRTLVLLAEVRAPTGPSEPAASVARLSELVTSGSDSRLREFLAALATVSLPDFPSFELAALEALRSDEGDETSPLERAFLDPVPGTAGLYRCFSRSVLRALRERLQRCDEGRYRALHGKAAERLRADADRAPASETALRRMHHLHEARAWSGLVAAMKRGGVQPSLANAVWQTAREELTGSDPEFEAIAEQVAVHYVQFDSHGHPDAVQACAVLIGSDDPRRRAWAVLKQAEAAILHGRYEEAVERLDGWQGSEDPLLEAEAALVRAAVARWRGDLPRAADIVENEARAQVARTRGDTADERSLRAKAALWAGRILSDRGELEAALREYQEAAPENDLLRARLTFRSADALMRLGRFEAAAEGFDTAVQLSRRSGAPASERARYLARRATLQRRRGELEAAAADLERAAAILADADGEPRNRPYGSARLHEDRALLLLAHGRHDEAIERLAGSVEDHRAYGSARGVNSAYRIDRAVLWLGVAYAARGLGVRWLPPFPNRPPEPSDPPDLVQARHLLNQVIQRRCGAPDAPQRADPLGRRALLVSSLIEPAESALAQAERALSASRFAHPRAEARAHLAAAQLRSGATDACRRMLDAACSDLRELRDDAGDPGMEAWLSALRLRAHVAADAQGAAMREVERLVRRSLPEAMRREALRAFGDALELEDRLAWLGDPRLPAVLAGVPEGEVLRAGDLLALRWSRRSDGNAASLGTVA